jgi:hypothetical protein
METDFVQVVSASKSLLADGSAKAPYLLSLYILAVGAGKLITLQFTINTNAYTSSHVQAKRLPHASRPDDDQSPESHHHQVWREGD